MVYQSLLGFERFAEVEPEKIVMPKYFYDLNLDQIVQDIMEEQKNYDLRAFYYFMVADEKVIDYRLNVLKDMDNAVIYQSIEEFGIGIRKVKEYLNNIGLSDYEVQKQKWNLDSAYCYVNSILKLKKELGEEELTSAGLCSFREWLNSYIVSEDFVRLKEDTEELMKQFDEMRFHIQLKRDRIIIKPGYLKEDYCKQLKDTFLEEDNEDHVYQKNPFGTALLSALEGRILDVLKKPFAQTFLNLREYDKVHVNFIHPIMNEFELESQFYISFLRYREKMKELKYHFCYPVIGNEHKFSITKGYDLALAKKNASLNKEVVYNDCYFMSEERFFVITGPNQGGKTTFARALGQIIYFASIGLMVPCESASIPRFDGIYTHFAVEENPDTGAGKLKEELLRMKDMMAMKTNHSFVIINEIFTSATSYDAYLMGKKVIDYYLDADCYGVYVTHIYELTKDDNRVVSLVAALKSEESKVRTFKIMRRPADGLSYANTIVEKYHMTYEEIKELIKNER